MKTFRKVLAIRLSALGDICMTLPVLDSVSRAYPDVQFTLLTSKAGAIVMETMLHQPNLSVKVINKRDYNGITGLNRLYKELKALDVDAVADLHDVLRTQWVDLRFWISGKPVKRIQKGRSEKKALTTGAIHRQLTTSIERYRQVFSALGLDFTIDYDATGRKGVHYDFYINGANGNRYVKFDDGALLSYQGDIDDEDLYSVIDMFSYFTQGKVARQWNVSKQGTHLKIDMVNPTLTVGTKAADAFTRGRRKADVERLETALRQLFGENTQITIVELDRKGVQLYRY